MYRKSNKIKTEKHSQAAANQVAQKSDLNPEELKTSRYSQPDENQRTMQLMIAENHRPLQFYGIIPKRQDSPIQQKKQNQNPEKLSPGSSVIQCYSPELIEILGKFFGEELIVPFLKDEDGGKNSLISLHKVFGIIGERLKSEENVEARELLNKAVVLVGNEISSLGKFTEIDSLPPIYQEFITSKKILCHDELEMTPNNPLGNNLINLSITEKGTDILLQTIKGLESTEKTLHFIKGGWTTADVSLHDSETQFKEFGVIKPGDIVIAANFNEPEELRPRAIDAEKRHIISPDVILLGHELGHVVDKVTNQENSEERQLEYSERKVSMKESEEDWQNIKEWGVTTKHQNPLEEEFNLPQRGTYLDRRSGELSMIFNELSRQLTEIELKSMDLKQAGIKAPEEIIDLFQYASKLVAPLVNPKEFPTIAPRLDEYKLKNAEEAGSLIERAMEAIEIMEKLLEAPEEVIPKEEESSSSSGGGWKCFITTACVEAQSLPDDCYELTTLRKFRDGYMQSLKNGNQMIEEYYRSAPLIVSQMKKSPQYEIIIQKVFERIQESVRLIEMKKYHQALLNYKSLVEDLKCTFL